MYTYKEKITIRYLLINKISNILKLFDKILYGYILSKKYDLNNKTVSQADVHLYGVQYT